MCRRKMLSRELDSLFVILIWKTQMVSGIQNTKEKWKKKNKKHVYFNI